MEEKYYTIFSLFKFYVQVEIKVKIVIKENSIIIYMEVQVFIQVVVKLVTLDLPKNIVEKIEIEETKVYFYLKVVKKEDLMIRIQVSLDFKVSEDDFMMKNLEEVSFKIISIKDEEVVVLLFKKVNIVLHLEVKVNETKQNGIIYDFQGN